MRQPVIKTQLEALFQTAANQPAVKQNLGGSDKITRRLIIDSQQLRDFAGVGQVAPDNDAFFLPNNTEMTELIKIIQSAAIHANP